MATLLAGCGPAEMAPSEADARPPTAVRVAPAEATRQFRSVTLTGEIAARVQSNLGFRLAGRIAERQVDVGDHVEKGQILAKLETRQQEADVRSAEGAAQSAQATLKQAQATFDRQQALLQSGDTTRAGFDDASKDLQSAKADLDRTNADLGTARDNLANTALRADEAGIVTQRNAEAGQVVEAAQTVFVVARDGDRDAVFEIYERLLTQPQDDKTIEIGLLSNPAVKTTGTVRETSPVVDPSTGTVRAKISLDHLPEGMALGAAVVGIGRLKAEDVFVVPWTALSVENGKAAVWVVDPATGKAAPRAVSVDRYRTSEVLLSGGLKPGDLIVTAGMQLLRPDEIVEPRPADEGQRRASQP